MTIEMLNDIKNYIKSNISAMKYVYDGGTGNAEISSVSEPENGIIRIEAVIEKSKVKITQINLYGKNGHLWAVQNTCITLDDTASGVIYRFEINLKEAVNNV